jgi:uncharacterized repeat protein (TIGR02543 family)
MKKLLKKCLSVALTAAIVCTVWATIPLMDNSSEAYADSTNRNAVKQQYLRANSCNIFFNANGGSVTPVSINITPGTAIGTLPVPTRAGYTFLGWYTLSSGGTKVTGTTVVTKNTTYYAHWQQSIKYYNIFFNANGGLVTPVSINIISGTAIGTLPVPTRAGYTFMGWYTLPSGGYEVPPSYLVNANVTFYARWEETYYKLTIDANGGSILDEGIAQGVIDRYVKAGVEYHLRDINATRSGYTFTGWYTAASGGTRVSDSSGTLVQNVSGIISSGKWIKKADFIIYAHWEVISSAENGWQKQANGTYKYYLSGIALTGWQRIGGKWYYLDSLSGGVMRTGWSKVSGSWYLLSSSGAMQTGWQKSGGKWYYLGNASSGVMKTGWIKVGSSWYLLNGSGHMLTGWQKSGGSWYYFNAFGKMLTGTQEIGGKTYRFNASGAWVA